MKLKRFKQLEDYQFILIFTNDEVYSIDLAPLISSYVTPDALQTARINLEWGCLEFNQGNVDIEPKTLYRFARTQPSFAQNSPHAVETVEIVAAMTEVLVHEKTLP